MKEIEALKLAVEWELGFDLRPNEAKNLLLAIMEKDETIKEYSNLINKMLHEKDGDK